MILNPDEFSRIDKLFVDRDEEDPAAARTRRAEHGVVLRLGSELVNSAPHQAALLTAANVAARCFPGAVWVDGSSLVHDTAVAVPWPCESLGTAVRKLGVNWGDHPGAAGCTRRSIVIGTRTDVPLGIQVTFDGWRGGVVPIGAPRLPEKSGMPLGGVLSGAMAVSEVFMRFAGVTPDATHRAAGLSLWRPDEKWLVDESQGPELGVLPAEAWILGLGHLGQAYVWCLGMLPYSCPRDVRLILQDFDRVVLANLDTCVLSTATDVGRLKSSVAARWLERRGFSPCRVDRRFDETVHRADIEPAMALCGFDESGPRELLGGAGFTSIVECGLGGQSNNFDALLLHTFPSLGRTPRDVWNGSGAADEHDVEKRVLSNRVYRSVRDEHGCGHMELAGRAIGVPFVGVVAACLVVSESLRAAHGGVRVESLEYRLSRPGKVQAHASVRDDDDVRASALRYQPAILDEQR